jgi:hypothetical protein
MAGAFLRPPKEKCYVPGASESLRQGECHMEPTWRLRSLEVSPTMRWSGLTAEAALGC